MRKILMSRRNVGLVDASNSEVCAPTSSPYTFSHTPYFEDLIVEIQSFNNNPGILAKFDTTTISGQVEWGATYYPISRPYGDDWYQQIGMVSSGDYNVCTGTWTSPHCYAYVSGGITAGTYGSFTATWVTSNGT